MIYLLYRKKKKTKTNKNNLFFSFFKANKFQDMLIPRLQNMLKNYLINRAIQLHEIKLLTTCCLQEKLIKLPNSYLPNGKPANRGDQDGGRTGEIGLRKG